MRKCLCFDESFDAPMVRRAITAYFGLTSFLDDNVGKILARWKKPGSMENTRIVYSSDHGDNLGTRGLWGKSTMYEESAGIPMIIAGPDVPARQGLRHAGHARGRLPDLHPGARRETRSARRRLPGAFAARHRARLRARSARYSREYHAAGADDAART